MKRTGHNYLRKLLLALVLVGVAVFSGNGLDASTNEFDILKVARILPPSPVAILWADDLDARLSSLNETSVMKEYFKSESYKKFRTSKLYNKLRSRLKGLESSTGFGLNLRNLAQISGSTSAVALYGIAELNLIYISKLDSAKFAASRLAVLREKFEPRRVGDIEYYVSDDPTKGSSLAFALHDGLLIASNDVALFEACLRLRAGIDDQAASMLGDKKLSALARDAQKSNVAIYLDMASISESVYFNTYWIYPDKRRYEDIEAALFTVEITKKKITENRRYLWAENKKAADTITTAGIAGLTPKDAHYLSITSTNAKDASGVLVMKLASWAGKGEAEKLSKTIEKLLEPAFPKTILSASKAQRDETDFMRPDAFIALEFAKPDSLDLNKLKSALASAWESRLIVKQAEGDWGRLKFKKTSGAVEYLDTPIFGSELISITRRGRIIALSTSAEWLKTSIAGSKNKPNLPDKSIEKYLRIDVPAASKAYIALAGDLELRPNWPDITSRKLFCTNLPSIVKAGTKSAVSLEVVTWPIEGNIQLESATLSLK